MGTNAATTYLSGASFWCAFRINRAGDDVGGGDSGVGLGREARSPFVVESGMPLQSNRGAAAKSRRLAALVARGKLDHIAATLAKVKSYFLRVLHQGAWFACKMKLHAKFSSISMQTTILV